MNPNQKEKLSCEARAKRKIKLQAEQEKLRVEEEAAIAMEEKRKLGAAKQRVETVLVEISGPDGHVGRCHIPTAAVVQLGLFRILLGGNPSVTLSDTVSKYILDSDGGEINVFAKTALAPDSSTWSLGRSAIQISINDGDSGYKVDGYNNVGDA